MPTVPHPKLIPPVRPSVSYNSPASVGPGRPSANLGHILNSSVSNAAHLFPHINVSNPIPFNIINPNSNPTTTNYGNRISAAVRAIAHPTAANVPVGQRPVTNLGHRITQAIRAVTRS